MEITGIDLFDQNVGMACVNVRLRSLLKSLVLIYLIKMRVWRVPKFRCSCILLVLIYFITMLVWHVPKLDLDVHGTSLVLIYLITMWVCHLNHI